MKFKNLLFILIFTNFYYVIICMENAENFSQNVENFSQEAADKQLLDIISKITLFEQRGFGVASNGERIGRYDFDTPQTMGSEKKELSNTSYLDLQPLEEAAIIHANCNILKNPKYTYSFREGGFYSRDKNPLKFESVTWNCAVEKKPQSLQSKCIIAYIKNNNSETIIKYLNESKNRSVINYLLTNLNAPQVMSKQDLIETYIPLDEIPSYECRFIGNNINQKFEERLKKYSEFNEATKLLENLTETKQMIAGYLNSGGTIMLPLKYCILYNNILFKKENVIEESASEDFQNSQKLATWLLHEREGWIELDELFAQTVSQLFEPWRSYRRQEESETLFIRCLALAKSYDILEKIQTKIDTIWSDKLVASKKLNIDFLEYCMNEKLITQKGLNNAFCAILQQDFERSQTSWQMVGDLVHYSTKEIETLKMLKNAGADNLDEALLCAGKALSCSGKLQMPNHVKAIELLLEWGADPNMLFYRNANTGKKECYLQPYAWYCGTRLLIEVLFHPQRTRDIDEPSDFEYLKRQKLSSIYSICLLGNKQIEGLKALYDYGEQLPYLAFEAYRTKKTEDIQKLRQHIIDFYDKQENKQQILADILTTKQDKDKKDNTNESLIENLPTKQDEKKIDITNQGNTEKPDHQNQKKLVTEDHEQRIDDPTQQKLTGNNTTYSLLQQKLYSLFGLFRPSNVWQNIYNVPRILLGKFYNLKSNLGF